MSKKNKMKEWSECCCCCCLCSKDGKNKNKKAAFSMWKKERTVSDFSAEFHRVPQEKKKEITNWKEELLWRKCLLLKMFTLIFLNVFDNRVFCFTRAQINNNKLKKWNGMKWNIII